MKGRLSLAFSMGALLALALAYPVHASTDAVDQSETSFTTSYQTLAEMAQTFTPSKAGQLDQVSLYAGNFARVTMPLTIEIWTVTAAHPAAIYRLNSTTVASTAATIDAGAALNWHDFPLSNAVPLIGGTQYAVVVRATKNVFRWGYETSETYAGGKLWLCCSGTGAWISDPSFGLSFDFKTWMNANTNTNQAPTVSADNAAVTVNEGTAPANTGKYSDSDGDVVAVTASTGSITTSGGAGSGTWSWSQTASDEASSQVVTITGDDGKGLNATTAFTVTINGIAPVARISSGSPALAAATTVNPSSPEGTAVSLSASATSPATADNTAGFIFTWTAAKNGNAYSSGTGPSFSVTPDDEGTFVVTLTAKDDGGLTGTSTLTFAGANVAPSAKISGVTPSVPLVVTAQESISFTGTFSDPGALDSHTATWTFGDGATSSTNYGPGGSAGFSTSHAYAAAGSYTVSLTVRDDDGGVGQASRTVVVQTPQAALGSIAGYVQGISTLNAGQKNSLIAKLNAASAAVTRGDIPAANNQLSAFLNELQADVNTGKVSPAVASVLRGAIHAVQAALGTYNRFLEWWPVEA